jgi:hypothetical protein
MAEGGAASTDDVSAASSFHSSRGDSVPAAMAAATRATAAGDDEDDLEALEFVARLRSKGKIEKMTTGRTAHNPRNLKHMWRLDLESGVPDVHGLSNTDLLTGCATSSKNPPALCLVLHPTAYYGDGSCPTRHPHFVSSSGWVHDLPLSGIPTESLLNSFLYP